MTKKNVETRLQGLLRPVGQAGELERLEPRALCALSRDRVVISGRRPDLDVENPCSFG